MTGANSIDLDGDERGVLLLHGFGDTPQSVASLAVALHRRGFSVRVPLLPGHGRSPEQFAQSRAVDWLAEARRAYDHLAITHEKLFLVGLSMGGALATWLSAELAPVPEGQTTGQSLQVAPTNSRVPHALVLLAPYLTLSRSGRFWTTIWPIWSIWRPLVVGDPEASIHDSQARRQSMGAGGATPRLLRELRRVVEAGGGAAPRLRLPTLAIFSSNDYRIPVDLARKSFEQIGAPVKEIRWVYRSGHVITVDRDAEEVIERTVRWLERFAETPPSSA